MHDVVGAEVIDIFDMQYDSEEMEEQEPARHRKGMRKALGLYDMTFGGKRVL